LRQPVAVGRHRAQRAGLGGARRGHCRRVAGAFDYALDNVEHQTQYFGLALGLAFVFLAAACVVVARRLVVTEELVEDYPVVEHIDEQEKVSDIVEESGSRFTRKRLVTMAAGTAGGALGAALIVPAVSLGPILDTSAFYRTPWRRGRRLVNEGGAPFLARQIEKKLFYTAFPEGANREDFGAPVVLVRIDPDQLELPKGRENWAPGGILAYSKICTHAGCAIALYRAPLFPPAEPKAAAAPPLGNMAVRKLTGGKVQNTPQNMIAWLQNPQAFDPGSSMPNLNVKPGDARDITAYLFTLR